MIATGMSLTGSATGCMSEEQNNDFHQCRGNRRMSSLFVEENDCSALFHSGANNGLAFWLYFVVSSYFLLNKKVNFFGGCSVKPEEKVSLSNRSIPNERTDNYWDSLLKLDEQDSQWISSSKQGMECVHDGSPISSYKINWGTEILPSVSTISSFTGAQCEESEDVFSAKHLLEIADIEELSGDEPLFWPIKGEFNWDSDESSFCSSPRKRLVFDSGSKTSMIKGCEQKSFDNFDSDMDIPLEYFELDQEFSVETLVGLKEFDGHEGLDSEFIGDDFFMLEESLQ
ncbi:hypothetical protein TSUD_77150 [Trifolium subterraneum]|uniref:Uncharacterized protein n=1 Tax=Trifolium subterraneum TaxID=3900 RepID=A0A2Z6LSQ3_TRISU|nr:hypothetical protein TSUD_77150 [Trifolium subterraneum]